MPRQGIFTEEHVDFLNALLHESEQLSAQEMSARMSKRFKIRITPANVNMLLTRMRKATDPFYRDAPYLRKGARRSY